MKTEPRLGQWVLWRERAAIYCGDGSGPSAGPVGARKVGVFDAKLSAFVPRALAPADVPDGHGIIDLVRDDGTTDAALLVAHEDLAEMTDVAQLPAARRAAAPEGWKPGGAGADRRMSDWGFDGGKKPTPDERRGVHDLVDAWTSARWDGNATRCAAIEEQLRAAGAWVRVRG